MILPAHAPTTTLLLLSVNVPLAVLVGVLLVSDYRREMKRATDVRRVVLSNEAALIGTAILKLSEPSDQATIQEFLESSCAETAGPHTPGHWIDVQWNGRMLHNHTASISQGVSSNHDTISGRFASESLKVEVTERGADIRQSVRGEVLMHVSVLLALASLAALIVDFVLVYLIARPTQRLAEAVKNLEANQFEIKPETFRSRELNELSTAITSMADSLRHAQTDHQIAMKRARRIQSHLLPSDVDIPGLAFASHFQPAEDVAGDIYGVMKLREGSWLLYIADLVGHGIPAAISAAVVKMLIESAASVTTDPGEILNRVNHMLPRYLSDGEFATAAILRWRPDTATMTFASAGHEPVLLATQRCLTMLDATGIPLGIDPTFCWSTTEHHLVPGDRLLLATDGFAEAHNADDLEFGRARLTELFNNSHADSIHELVDRLVRELVTHRAAAPVEDDVTFLVAECQLLDAPHFSQLEI